MNLPLYRNNYDCPCGTSWSDDWDCMCDDRCPVCNTSCSPTDSDELNQPSDEETLEECKARLQRISEETKAEIKAGKFKPGYTSKKPKDTFTDVDYAKLEARVMSRDVFGLPPGSGREAMRFLEMYADGTITGRLTHREPRMEEIPREMPMFGPSKGSAFDEYMQDMYTMLMHEALHVGSVEMKTAMLGGRGSGKSSMLDDIREALVSKGEITKMIASMYSFKKEPMIIIDSYPPGIEMWGEDMKIPEPPEIMRVSYSKEEIPPKKRGFEQLNPTPKHPKRGK